ncbi:MAG: AraC family transcriptional regulator [Brevundimonas sp.]|nr:MAG: AraC family transcriptional regulator [Brevundimonas sp.]
MTFKPDRMEQGRPMLLAGLRRHYGFEEGPTLIPQDWERFAALLPLPDQTGDSAYGAMCGTDLKAQSFEYMAAVEVTTLDNVPEGLGKMRVPEALYAVFKHEGHVSGIHQTWAGVHEWLPQSGWTPAATPDFERYGPAFDPGAGLGDIEIWVPVLSQLNLSPPAA